MGVQIYPGHRDVNHILLTTERVQRPSENDHTAPLRIHMRNTRGI